MGFPMVFCAYMEPFTSLCRFGDAEWTEPSVNLLRRSGSEKASLSSASGRPRTQREPAEAYQGIIKETKRISVEVSACFLKFLPRMVHCYKCWF